MHACLVRAQQRHAVSGPVSLAPACMDRSQTVESTDRSLARQSLRVLQEKKDASWMYGSWLLFVLSYVGAGRHTLREPRRTRARHHDVQACVHVFASWHEASVTFVWMSAEATQVD